MTNLSTAIAQLDSALKILRRQWEGTHAVWQDQVSYNFEKEYWSPLERQTQATQREMEQLAQVIAQARRHVK